MYSVFRFIENFWMRLSLGLQSRHDWWKSILSLAWCLVLSWSWVRDPWPKPRPLLGQIAKERLLAEVSSWPRPYLLLQTLTSNSYSVFGLMCVHKYRGFLFSSFVLTFVLLTWRYTLVCGVDLFDNLDDMLNYNIYTHNNVYFCMSSMWQNKPESVGNLDLFCRLS